MTPRILYGTAWKEDRTEALATLALKQGFRGIDTANQRKHYFEEAVGRAITKVVDQGIVGRDELFVQTKFTHLGGQDHRLPYDPQAPVDEQVRQSFASSVRHLGAIDSLLLHGPTRRVGLGEKDIDAYNEIGKLLDEGRIKYLGVSNVSSEQLQLFCQMSHRPHFVQNRCYARTGWDSQVREICREHNVVYQGFSLLTANVRELSTPQVKQLASGRQMTTPQLVFAFALQLGMLPLTGTSNCEHMRQDLEALGQTLKPNEIEILLGLANM